MNEEEINTLKEMRNNCLNSAKYIDPKAMEKYNLLRKIENKLNNWNELEKWLEESRIKSIEYGDELIISDVLDKMQELEGVKDE